MCLEHNIQLVIILWIIGMGIGPLSGMYLGIVSAGIIGSSFFWHYHARQRAFGNINNNSMICVSVTQFDPSQHNINSNLSFDDATMNTSEDEDNTTHNNNTADSNNSNDDSST